MLCKLRVRAYIIHKRCPTYSLYLLGILFLLLLLIGILFNEKDKYNKGDRG